MAIKSSSSLWMYLATTLIVDRTLLINRPENVSVAFGEAAIWIVLHVNLLQIWLLLDGLYLRTYL